MANSAKIVVGVVWLVIIFQFAIFSLIFLSQMASKHPVIFWFISIPFVIFSLMTCLCYYKATTTAPGTPNHLVNLTYQNLDEIKKRSDDQTALKKQIRKLRSQNQPHPQFDQIEALTRVGYCNACQVIKDVRVHHCKMCNKCIVRMDHHCPWIGNCVGKNNHKFFIQFLFYATAGLLVIWMSIVVDWLFGDVIQGVGELWMYPVYVCGVSSLMLDLAIGLLFFSQVSLLSHNITTLESFVPGIFYRNPWRKDSFKQCMEQIWGRSSLVWPTKPFDEESYVQIEL